MKQILTILSLLITSIAFAQVDTFHVKVQGKGSSVDSNYINSKLVEKLNISDTASMLSRKLNISDTTDMLNSYLQKINGLTTVINISELESYGGSATTLFVKDTLRGGLFNYVNDGVVDDGIVFAATGKGSGYWLRQYDRSKGVNVDWWGDRNDISVNAAINYIGVNGTINFTNGAVYTLSNSINVLAGQILNGNGATLKRANDSVVVLTSSILSSDSSFTVNAIPSSWYVPGGYYQFFSDSTNTNASISVGKSESIAGNTVKLTSTIGMDWDATTTFVRRSFSMINALYLSNVEIRNLNFDGNRDNTSINVSWRANSTILAYGYGNIVIDNCNFTNIPNENIVGQGLRITNNNASYLNGSFVHLSAEADRVPAVKPSIIANNITKNTNEQLTKSGHAEGVITNSFSPGNVTIINNRFSDGGIAGVFGYIQSDSNVSDGAYKNVLIANNYAENFNKIFYYLSILPSLNRNGHVFISNNTFNNCGINDWTSYKDSIDLYTDSIMVGNNMLVGGTIWKIPIQKSDSLQRYILNNATGYPQGGEINIAGKASFGDTVRLSKIPNGVGTDSILVTNTKLIKKIAYSALSFLPLTGGNVSGNIIFSNNVGVYGRLTSATPVPMVMVDASNNIKIGSNAVSNSLLYSNNDFVFYTEGELEKLRIKGNGNTLIGTAIDNGIDLLQVNGTMTANSYDMGTTSTPSPASGHSIIWFDGTNVKVTKNVSGTTTTTTLF